MDEVEVHPCAATGVGIVSVALPDHRNIPRRSVVSWVLYDLANTIFSMGVVSLYFSLFIRGEVGSERADSVYGVISAVSMGLIFVLSPALGAMTDRARRRMPFLAGATLICVGATALIGAGPFALSVGLFIIANAAYQAGVQFYDALLPEVTHPGNRGRISGIGVGVGYIGSYFAVGVGFLVSPDNHSALFGLLAAAFLLFALPCFLFVRERGNPAPRPVISWEALRSSAGETLRTMRATQEFPGLARFLVGRVFYTDAINTVIAYMGLYTVNVSLATGLSAEQGRTQAQLVLLSAVTASVAGGIAWGFAVDRFGPKRTLNAVLILWVGVFAFAAAIGFFTWPIVNLYLVASLAGVALGGIWSADRPYMLRLSPPDRIGEFYGLYGMVGRFSAITGPLLWATIVYVAVDRLGLAPLTGQAMAITSLLAMTLIGYVILRPVSDSPRAEI
jgi:UMF1 family MFS transporter